MNPNSPTDQLKSEAKPSHMFMTDIVRIALRMVRTNLLRTLLTVMGIGVAITFIVLLIGLGYGLQSLTIGSIVSSKTLFSLNVQADTEKKTVLNDSTVQAFKSLPGVSGISPVVTTSGQVTIAGQLANVGVESGTAAYLTMEGIEFRNGRAYDDGTREVVVSPEVIELLGLAPQDVLNTTVKLNFDDPNNHNDTRTLENMIIVGVAGATGGPTIYLPISLIDTDGKTTLSFVKLVGRDRESIIALRNTIASKGYQVESLLETLDQAKQVFRWTTVGLAGFGAIALIVASIGMFNTLTIALIERTREIGIMKAVGVTDESIRRLFLAEAAIIGLLGGITGIVAGLFWGYIFETILNSYARNYDAHTVALFQYPPGFLIGILLFPMFLAMITGLYPAMRAAKLNPLQALRYE